MVEFSVGQGGMLFSNAIYLLAPLTKHFTVFPNSCDIYNNQHNKTLPDSQSSV